MIDHNGILVLAPHTDDGEFGCGGSISKWLAEKRTVYYVAFSSAEKSVPPGLPKSILRTELRKATKSLGIHPQNLIIFDYPVREFPAHRQEILEDMIRLRKKLKPDLVVLPSAADTHQDHQIISQESFRAFKTTSMIGYEMPYNNLSFQASLFVALKEEHLQMKLNALKQYKSQKSRSYAADDYVRGIARVRGVQIGIEYAEAFEVIRWIIR